MRELDGDARSEQLRVTPHEAFEFLPCALGCRPQRRQCLPLALETRGGSARGKEEGGTTEPWEK